MFEQIFTILTQCVSSCKKSWKAFQININKLLSKLNLLLWSFQIEDANFFVNASLNAIGSECKSPSSVNSGSASTAAIGGGPIHHVPGDTFVFPSTASSGIAEVSMHSLEFHLSKPSPKRIVLNYLLT